MNKKAQDDKEIEVEKEHVHGPGCHHDHAPKSAIRTTPKVGRNDPCPCGSQKKFKKCCGK
jgi:uncharacterized protein YecA (UPF0149 family)